MVTAVNSPFLWGEGGQKLTPEQVAQKRKQAELASLRAGDTSPVGHWTQGAARVVDALGGVLNERRANRAEEAGLSGADDYIANNPVLSAMIGSGGGGITTGIPAGVYEGGGPMAVPNMSAPLSEEAQLGNDAMAAIGKPPIGGAPGVDTISSYIIQAAQARGIDPNVALAVAKSEGLNADPNEAWQSRVVKDGKRERSFGPYQLYIDGGLGNQFMESTGMDPRDASTWQHQVDFALDHAKNNGWGAWYGARDTGIGNYDGIGGTPSGQAPVAMGGGSSMGGSFTGGNTQMAGNSNVVAALTGAMSDPWVAKKYGPAIQAMLGQQMKRGDMDYQARLQQQDPMYQAKLAQLQNPAEGAGAGVRSSQILADGTLVQSTDAGPRVFGPTGDQLTGQEAADAIKAANAYDVENQQQIYGGRRSGTLGADIDMGGAAASSVESGKIAAEAGNAAYEGYQKVMGNLSNIYEAVAAIDSGAQSGIMQKHLPNISVASATLANTMNRMGLDVIGSVTFGALSEAEMNLAMDTAVPRDLSPPELREWLVAKGEAQQKAAEALYQAGQYLSKPGNTIDSWMAENPPEFVQFGQPQADTNLQPQSAPAPNDQTSAEQGAMDFSQMSAGEMVQIDIGSLKPEQMDAFDARMKELGY